MAKLQMQDILTRLEQINVYPVWSNNNSQINF